VLIPLEQMKSQSMKLPVAPQSRSVLMKWSLLVLVVLTSIGRTKNVLHVSRALVKSCLGSHFSYLGFWGGILIIGVEKGKDMSLGSLSLVFTLSI